MFEVRTIATKNSRDNLRPYRRQTNLIHFAALTYIDFIKILSLDQALLQLRSGFPPTKMNMDLVGCSRLARMEL